MWKVFGITQQKIQYVIANCILFSAIKFQG